MFVIFFFPLPATLVTYNFLFQEDSNLEEESKDHPSDMPELNDKINHIISEVVAFVTQIYLRELLFLII